MEKNMSLFIASLPDNINKAAAFGIPVAYMAYKIGPGLHLFRSAFPEPVKQGLMCINVDGNHHGGMVSQLSNEIIRECLAKGFSGILLDAETPPSPIILQLTEQLYSVAAEKNWRFILPPVFPLGNITLRC